MGNGNNSGLAIIGMACRFPGAADWRSFWRNICDGVESISFFTDEEMLAAGVKPADLRDPDYVKAGFLLPEPDGFDTAFFGYSPHEARLIDPQQRLMLESAWEAFEDAGYVPGRAIGPVGVYAATGSVVTNYMINELSDHPDSRGKTGSVLHISNDKDFAGTRVSYKLDLTGPSLNVQTACSTSLVLIHLACQAIRNGECKLALAVAATMRVPHTAGYLAVKGGIMSPEGHVRTFDAAAEGTVFSSGAAGILLKDLNQAVADGDHIYAVIRGSAVNNDGARKNSFSGTSARAQAQAMSAALTRADFPAATIGYVECHGTGTAVGDPLEVVALNRAFGDMSDRSGKCLIGSVKPNIGHCEQSSGLASVIKTALALEYGIIPSTINYRTPNPRIKFENSSFAVVTQLSEWSEVDHPRRALVNGLGIGGTNAVTVLEQAPVAPTRPPSVDRPAHVFVLSAKTAVALEQTVARHIGWLEVNPNPVLADVCHTLATGRTNFAHRFATVVASPAELVKHLGEFRGVGQSTTGEQHPRKIGFLYSGQGAQVIGMGQQLYNVSELFRVAIDRVAEAMRHHLERPLLDVLFGKEECGAMIVQTRYAQPALFAVEVGLAELLGSWGIRPDAVIGHSVGEFAAAMLAGAYTLEEAARLVCERGRLMQTLSSGGAMVAAFDDEATVAEVIAPLDAGRIGIAAVNSPRGTVVSGDSAAVDEAVTLLELRGIAVRPLKVSHAFHSPMVDPILDELRQVAGETPAQAAAITWVSTLTGQPMTEAPTADYWCRQARGAVRFADAIGALVADGVTDFIEIGPGKSLLAHGKGSVSAPGLAWLPTLGKERDEWSCLLESVASLYRRGHVVDWPGFDAPFSRRRLSLPTYAFERQRVWIAKDYQAAESVRRTVPSASWTGTRLLSPLKTLQFESVYSRTSPSWLDDHRIHGAIVLPTTAGLLAVLEGAGEHFGDADLEIVDFIHGEAMVLADDEERLCHLVIEPIGESDARFALSSTHGESDASWSQHMQGSIRLRGATSQVVQSFDVDTVRRRCGQPVVAERYYTVVKSLGLGYGSAFRGVQSLWRGDGEALARVRLPDQIVVAKEMTILHPAFLDACLHVYPAVINDHGNFIQMPPSGTVAYLPLAIKRCSVSASNTRDLWVHARYRKSDGNHISIVDINAYDPEGRCVALFEGLSVKALSADLFRPAGKESNDGWLYRMRWNEQPLLEMPAPNATPMSWLLLGGDDDGITAALKAALVARGAPCRVVSGAEAPDTDEDFAKLVEALVTEAGGGLTGIVYFAGVDAATVGETGWTNTAVQRRVYGSTLALARTLTATRNKFRAAPRLWLATRNGAAVNDGDPPVDVLQAGLWGLGRSLALENPTTWGGLVDLEAGATVVDEGRLLASQLVSADGETQVAFRHGQRLVLRLVRAPQPPRRAQSARQGTYLVTGGLGALGLEVAAWLASHRGAHTLVLVSRKGIRAVNAKNAKRQLGVLGAKVSIVKADVTNEADVRKLMVRLGRMTPPLAGIYHSAGVLADGLIDQMDWFKFRQAIAPKLDAAWFLHHYSRELNLDEFVLFSSVLSLIGSAGQTNYTTGNACLDGLAAHRRSLGLPALSINWGPWSGNGMAGTLGEQGEAGWRARGMHFISPELGRTAFDVLFESDLDNVSVAVIEWAAFLRQFPTAPPLYVEVQGGAAGAGLNTEIEELRSILASGDADMRRSAIIAFLCERAMVILGLAQPADPERPLRELGLDSLMAIDLINYLDAAVGVRIPTIKLIKGPSIAQLVGEVWPEIAEIEGTDAVPMVAAEPIAPVDHSVGKWLVTVTQRAKSRFRLFCFPFAGGGSAAFQGWKSVLDASIEVIAVEAPGRLARINERPVSDLNVYVSAVVDEMRGMTDLPFAFFGHCLGGLTLYEVARRLGDGVARPSHLFCSGARAPDRLDIVGPFENSLARHLKSIPGYKPSLPPHSQPDHVFAEIIRHFDMPASEQFLDDPELRRLMLPAVRAEFAMASNYRFRRERPWDIPITCFVAKGDPYVSRQDILSWGRFTNSRMQVYMREGTHYSLYEDAAFIQRVISRELMAPAI